MSTHETARLVVDITLSTPDDGGELPTNDEITTMIRNDMHQRRIDCLAATVIVRTGDLG